MFTNLLKPPVKILNLKVNNSTEKNCSGNVYSFLSDHMSLRVSFFIVQRIVGRPWLGPAICVELTP